LKHPIVILVREPTRLEQVLPRLGEEARRALDEGRVFIGVRRAKRASEPVAAGDEVRMYPARPPAAESPRILAERAGVVAAYKPASIATVADHRGAAGTLEREVAKLLGTPTAVLTPSSRLDVGVSGVVLFTCDDDAHRLLARAREQRRYRRHYVAIAQGAPDPSRGTWTAPIGRARDPRKRQVGGTRAAAAVTAYAVAESAGPSTLLAIEPETGRTHQIRVHAAHAGCPLLGDATYGGMRRLVSQGGSVILLDRIALHAAWVEVPLAAETFRVEAPTPDDLVAIWTALGGAPSAWTIAANALVHAKNVG
jgi:23S rRNA-/tRNA-specific pseudouridylate synthase